MFGPPSAINDLSIPQIDSMKKDKTKILQHYEVLVLTWFSFLVISCWHANDVLL